MKAIKRLQKGVMMIEVVAVLGLLAAITPMLFQQISRRNDEILNVQVATEMRAIKDALSAFIQANESTIADGCGSDGLKDSSGKYKDVSKNGGGEECLATATQAQIESFIEPFFAGNPIVLGSYDVRIFGYTVPSEYDSEGHPSAHRPFIYGIVAQKPIEEDDESYAPQGLKNASKIAALIGLDGGVVVDDGDGTAKMHGIQGSWVLDNFDAEDAIENTVVAITAFDTQTTSAILKDVKLEHFKGQTMQTDQAVADRLSLREVLSVGNDDCIEFYGNTNVGVKKKGETAAGKTNTVCVPFFEIDSTTGKVTVSTGVIESGVKYTVTGSNEERNYKLDLAGTSEMHDIKLTSLGGVKLSEVVPKWMLVNAIRENCSSASVSIDPWNCPENYQRGIIVIPTSFRTETSNGNASHSHTLNGEPYVNSSVPSAVDNKITISCSYSNGNVSKVLIQEYCVRDPSYQRSSITCPANTYYGAPDSNYPNEKTCIPCIGGKESPAGSTSSGACTCPNGTTWNDTTNLCVKTSS